MSTSRPLSERLTARNSVLWCELEVGALTVKVFLVNRRSRVLGEWVNEGKQGGWDPDTATIVVGWDLEASVATEVCFHELHHAVIYAHGVKLHPDREVDEDEEEIMVNALSANMCATLVRNSLLFLPPRPEIPATRRKKTP